MNQTTDDPEKVNGAALPLSPTTLLVVDDDPDVLWSTSRILRDAGFIVVEGAGAADAIKLTREHCPALVLLDVELPDGNGVDVALHIKNDPALSSVFVVLCSGKRISPKDQVEGLRRGLADGYIIRPVGKDELIARIDAFLRIRSALETLRQTNRELFRLRNNAEKQSVELQRANDQLQTEILERKAAEEEIRLLNVGLEKRVTERTADLQEALTRIEKSLHEKEVMLREIHHRVKNNLQIIISLLNLQSRQFADPQIGDALRESQNRVRAISMVHERLFISNDIEKIDLDPYIRSLATNLISYYQISTERVQIHVAMEGLTTTIDTAVPLGLIINELIANALRYAFPDERAGEITITGTDAGGKLEIRVTDNGVGMPAAVHPDEAATLGLKLVDILSQQLNGTVEYLPPPGTTVVLRIPIH